MVNYPENKKQPKTRKKTQWTNIPPAVNQNLTFSSH